MSDEMALADRLDTYAGNCAADHMIVEAADLRKAASALRKSQYDLESRLQAWLREMARIKELETEVAALRRPTTPKDEDEQEYVPKEFNDANIRVAREFKARAEAAEAKLAVLATPGGDLRAALEEISRKRKLDACAAASMQAIARAALAPAVGTEQEMVPKHLLNGRDDFIVSKGLWSDFTASLDAATQLAARATDAQEANERPLEVWNGDRKVTVYRDTVLRVWGPDMDNEMSDAPRTHETVEEAFKWLYAPPQRAATDRRREEIARIINPFAFFVDPPRQKDSNAKAGMRESALAKADAILSLVRDATRAGSDVTRARGKTMDACS